MKLWNFVAVLILIVNVKGWVMYIQPIILSIGAVFTGLSADTHSLDLNLFDWRDWLPFAKKKEPKVEGKVPTKAEIEEVKSLIDKAREQKEITVG